MSLLGEPMPSRFPERPPQPAGVAPGGGQVVRARQVIITGAQGGLFVYNSAGTLVASIAGAAGTDPVDHSPVLPIIAVYDGNGGSVRLDEAGGQAFITMTPGGAAHVTAAPQIFASAVNRGAANERNELQVYSGTSNGRTAAAYVIDSAAADNSTGATHRWFAAGVVMAAISAAGLFSGNQAVLPPSGDASGATDLARITAALNGGQSVQLLPGTYYTSGPLTIPTGLALHGASAGLYDLSGTVIKAVAGFSGAAMITMPVASQAQDIRDLCLDGSAMPAGTCDAIAPPSSPSHTVLSVKLENLAIMGAGFSHGIGDINAGTTWRGKRIFVDSVNATAFNIRNAPDSCWIDCASLGAGNHGWQPFGAANATFIGCRAEFSTGNGFNLSGAWGTGNGSGGLQFTDCSTDRNTGNGVFIDATGTAPVTFSGLMTRRDGNGTGDAGVHVAAGATVIPVLLGDWQCFPGVNDNGTGTLTPQFGLNVTGAVQYIGLSNAFIHAATTATNGMTIANGVNWRAVATRTGTTGAPGAITIVADSA